MASSQPRTLSRRAAWIAIIAPALGACAAPVQRGLARPPAALEPPVLPAPLTVARLRLLVPEAQLPPGLTLTEELVPKLDWRTPQEDPWGRVASYAATFTGTGSSSGTSASAARDAAGGEVTISLNSYLDPARASSAFGEWRSLVPRQYAPLARGAWRDAAWAPDALVAVYTNERLRASLVGFCAGPLMGSVRVASAASQRSGGGTDEREAYDGPSPTVVALELAARVAAALRRAVG